MSDASPRGAHDRRDAPSLGAARVGSSLLVKFFFLSVALVLVMASLYGVTARATADDICGASLSTAPGAWLRHVAWAYRMWTGRWLEQSIYPLTFPYVHVTTATYNLVICLSGFLWWAIFYLFVSVAFWGGLSLRQKLALSLTLTAVSWASTPGVDETWYWLTGLVVYTLPLLLSMASLYALARPVITGGGAVSRTIGFALSAVFAVACTGLNELVGLFQIGMFAIALAIAAQRRRTSYVIALAALVALVAIGIVVNQSAPGNVLRAARDFPDGGNLKIAISFAFFQPHQSPLQWLVDARVLSLSALLVLTPAFTRLDPPWLSTRLPVLNWAIAAPALAVLASYAGVFVTSYAEGKELPMRVMTVIQTYFLMGWFAALLPVAKWLIPADGAQSALTHRLRAIATLAAALALLFAPTTVLAVMEFRYITPPWSRAVDARDAAIRAQVAAGVRDVRFPPIGLAPKLYFWKEMATDPREWRNVCYAKFVGAHTLALEPPRPVAPKPFVPEPIEP